MQYHVIFLIYIIHILTYPHTYIYIYIYIFITYHDVAVVQTTVYVLANAVLIVLCMVLQHLLGDLEGLILNKKTLVMVSSFSVSRYMYRGDRCPSSRRVASFTDDFRRSFVASGRLCRWTCCAWL
jgi:hypothetical protein